MHLKRTIRRGLRRLVQLYADAARAHTAHGHASVTPSPCDPVDATRRGTDRRPDAHDESETRHG
ncbi:hypothetical protein ACISU4_13175 [Streptomyces wuyuanensis]|uniref:hypothetical protein n=1 Tax=Streptomyces wuyuanensis TaxID=1196353 RepID=UPI00380B9B1C